MYVVTKHKGKTGKSVFEWRVYSVWDQNGRQRKTQLAKYRTEAEAARCLEQFAAKAKAPGERPPTKLPG